MNEKEYEESLELIAGLLIFFGTLTALFLAVGASLFIERIYG